MERENAIRELQEQIESMARLHVRHGLYHSEGFQRRREQVKKLIREHGIDVKKELDPMVGLLYRRYFD
ncbi:MAG: hypothetical protein ACSW8E_05250 [Clostridia bacterium]